MGVAAVDYGAVRPSSNTVHQRATGSVTFTGALTSALWLVCRLGATSTDSPAPYLLTLTDSLTTNTTVKSQAGIQWKTR